MRSFGIVAGSIEHPAGHTTPPLHPSSTPTKPSPHPLLLRSPRKPSHSNAPPLLQSRLPLPPRSQEKPPQTPENPHPPHQTPARIRPIELCLVTAIDTARVYTERGLSAAGDASCYTAESAAFATVPTDVICESDPRRWKSLVCVVVVWFVDSTRWPTCCQYVWHDSRQ